MPPTSALSSYNSALYTLTDIKVRELARRKEAFDKRTSQLESRLAQLPSYREKLSVLLSDLEVNGEEQGSENIKTLVEAGTWDLCASEKIYKEKFEDVTRKMRQTGRKVEFSYLFGCLLDEWLKNEGRAEEDVEEEGEQRPDMIAQRDKLEGIAYESGPADLEKFKALLEGLFGREDDAEEPEDLDTRALRKHLTIIREKTDELAKELHLQHVVSNNEVRASIRAALAGDMLPKMQKMTARELLKSQTILDEIAAVVTLSLRDLANWGWPEEGVEIVMRRHLNGKYRGFLNEDLITAIFLQFLGLRWSTFFKRMLGGIVSSSAWKWGKSELSKQQMARRRMFLSSITPTHKVGEREMVGNSIESERIANYKENYFLTSLPKNIKSLAYDAEDEDEDNSHRGLSLTQLKPFIIRRFLADVSFTHTAYPGRSITAVTADAYNFAPSLNHDLLLHCLEFLGMPPLWLSFFRQFLKPKTRFQATESFRENARGLPIAHTLGVMMSELLLFFLDLTVNRVSDGASFYRMHDDFFWWDSDETKVVLIWETMNSFATMCGFSWNVDKSGSCKVSCKTEAVGAVRTPGVLPLPQTVVKWGLLCLESTGKFSINQEAVEWHRAELEKVFAKTTSVLGYIKAYNRYLQFFLRGTHQTSRVFGRQHVEAVLETLKTIHTKLFPAHNGNLLALLSTMITERFSPSSPIPEAWLVWPMTHGGLGCPMPMMETYTALLSFTQTTAQQLTFEKLVREYRELYEQLVEIWNDRTHYPSDITHLLRADEYSPDGRPLFMSFAEFSMGRRELSEDWAMCYSRMMMEQEPAKPEELEIYDHWISTMLSDKAEDSPFRWKRKLKDVDGPWDWVLVWWGEQMLETFGELGFMDPTLLPSAMIGSFKVRNVKWD